MKNLLKLIVLLILPVCTYAQIPDSFSYEKTQSFSEQIVQQSDNDSLVTFEKIVIDGYDSKVPFYHFNNQKNRDGHYIILLHGLGSSKEDWNQPSMPYFQWTKNLTEIKDSLLTLGFNIIIPDAKYHGERSYELNFRPPEQLPPVRSKNQEDALTYYTMVSGTVKDIRIIMDYIESRNQNQKVSFSLVGYSMGGAMSILLNASDNRIKSVVACVPPLERPENEAEDFDWSSDTKKALHAASAQNYAQFQQSPVLLLMGEHDPFITKREVLSFIENVPVQEKEFQFFDSGHELPNAYINDVINWIRTYNKK